MISRLVPTGLTLLLMSAAVSAAPLITFEERPWGRLGLAELASAPFPHHTRAEGFQSGDNHFRRDPHYVDSSVAFLVPSGYVPGEQVDLIVHFHGHQSDLAETIPRFQLGEQLEASGVNAILIVPQGPKMASDSRNGKIDEPGGFTALIEESLAVLRAGGVTRTEELGSVIIMGHSGGFHTLGQIIANGDLAEHILELWLFDATYAQLDHFASFAERPETRMRSIFTGHLSEENVDLMCDLQHRMVPYLLLHDVIVTDALLASEKVIFLHTDLRHDPLVYETRNVERWLRASAMPRRP